MNNNAKNIYLGFDFGTKLIGVAVGQAITKTATPLPAIKAHEIGLKLVKLIKSWQPSGIIVGVPIDKTLKNIQPLVKKFIVFLKENTTLPIYEVDETLTTKAARSEIYENEGYKGLEKAKVDSLSAKIILESWLRESYCENKTTTSKN